MKKQLITILKTLLILMILSAFFFYTYKDEFYKQGTKETEKKISFEIESILRPIKPMTNANGIATNIWIEKENIDNLKQHEIKYLFVDIGDINQNGEIITPSNEINNFLNLIEEYETENNYDFILLPYTEVNTYDYDITNFEFRDNFVKEHLNLVELGFDGVYVDIEPVRLEQKQIYLNLLENLEKQMPEEKILGVYSGVVSEYQTNNEWEWDINFYNKVSNRVDLIFVPGYDYNINDKNKYQDKIKEQINILSSRRFNSYFMLGVPTHKQGAETIENALTAYSLELKQNPNNQFLGTAIFAEWTIDENKWEVFEKYK